MMFDTMTEPTVAALFDEVSALRADVAREGDALLASFSGPGSASPAVANLAHYMALRHRDLRALQRHLMWRGLSSLGRLESRVLPTLDALLSALAAQSRCEADASQHRFSPYATPTSADYFAGEVRLNAAADQLLGPQPATRATRIMVTLPSEAATDPAYVLGLAERGMEIARINCAHDGAEAWRAMATNVRMASITVGRPIAVLMDIAGPKIRTEAVEQAHKKAKLTAGDRLRLVAMGKPRLGDDVAFSATVSLPEMVTRLSVGDRLLYDDGKLAARIVSVGDNEAVALVERTKTGGVKLKSEKGVNLPDTALGLSPLTTKDEADLATVMECADLLGYSFVSRPDDLDLLEAAIERTGPRDRPLGLIAKIELPEAVLNLPALIARASGRRLFGVMIARGDLAAEIGFERLAEIQEELLWLCEAGAVPVIWATQVLETLVKDGVPSRGEMTDAAMSARAECVMLNKGPALPEAIEVLDRLLSRMSANMSKKTPTLRALKSW